VLGWLIATQMVVYILFVVLHRKPCEPVGTLASWLIRRIAAP
jgi:hypothetical protein